MSEIQVKNTRGISAKISEFKSLPRKISAEE